MSQTPPNSIDPNNGFCKQTKIYHSLRPPIPLPDPNLPQDVTTYCFSLLPSPPPPTTAFIDAGTGRRCSYADLRRDVEVLAAALQSLPLTKGQTAFILSPTSIEIPILYLSLLSIGVIVSPANPVSTASEIAHQIEISKPHIAFADSANTHKIPPLKFPTIIIDSPDFTNLMISRPLSRRKITVSQLDTAAILFSSGTTGHVKGVELTHRNLIAVVAANYAMSEEIYQNKPKVPLFTIPLFHVYGFYFCIKAVALAETAVFMRRFEMEGMLRAVEQYKVTYMPVSPPLVVALAKLPVVEKYDLRSLEALGCGGAPLGKEVIDKFAARFPNVEIIQGYGLTESTGSATRTYGPEENLHYGSAGRLSEGFEAKIVDPVTGEALPPGQQGELWLRGPTIMRGYVGNNEATISTLDSEGWLKTGDLCYFDYDGFLFIVDRLKELIKYKAYQVAPAELEQLLQSHPEIVDAAVIPYPHEETGQIPMAFVVRQPESTLTEAQVMDFVAKQPAVQTIRTSQMSPVVTSQILATLTGVTSMLTEFGSAVPRRTAKALFPPMHLRQVKEVVACS